MTGSRIQDINDIISPLSYWTTTEIEPNKQVQQARQESLRNLLTEIEKNQSTLQERKENLERLFQK